jgi:hypothetical protein
MNCSIGPAFVDRYIPSTVYPSSRRFEVDFLYKGGTEFTLVRLLEKPPSLKRF